jgi:hypothetical protein
MPSDRRYSYPLLSCRSSAFNNIIANAIQYNRPGGQVVITIRPDASVGRVEIADTGIGIPAWAVPRVFDRFFRVDEARSREAGGAGLGLSVAHAIVNVHGGTLQPRGFWLSVSDYLAFARGTSIGPPKGGHYVLNRRKSIAYLRTL